MAAITVSEQLLTLNHAIRQTDNALKVARRRKKLSNLSLIFGPVLAVALYSIAWIPSISRTTLLAIYIPTIPVAVGFGVASFWLKTHPGGPKEGRGGRRPREDELELELARQRDTRKLVLAQADVPIRVRRLAYREDAHADIDQYRDESRGYRRVSNNLQGTVIIGSLAATAASGVTAAFPSVRWVTLGVTFVVGRLFKRPQFDSGSRIMRNRHQIDSLRFGAPAGATASPSDRRDVSPTFHERRSRCAMIVCQALTQSNSTNWYGASKISLKSRGIKESGVRRTFLCEKPSSWHAAICDRT